MTIEKRLFGRTSTGENVDSYVLKDAGYTMEILTYGGAIRSLVVPVEGGVRDVALGFDTVAEYEAHKAFFGAIIGRVGNRIGGARFSLNGKEYNLDKNDGPNTLHGGFKGFDKKVWQASVDADALVLKYTEKDKENGFPGNLDTEVRYSLKNGVVLIDYKATCDEDTPINLTNHNYFNLGGHSAGGIEEHKLQILAEHITPIDDTLIPTGALMDVAETPFDFRKSKAIGDDIDSTHEQIKLGGGYDHNFVLSKEPERKLSLAAVLEFDGLKMQCLTTSPGVQFYSGNFLTDMEGKAGAKYKKRHGLCLETQNWPDAVNKPEFPNSILKKGEVYRQATQYSFEKV